MKKYALIKKKIGLVVLASRHGFEKLLKNVKNEVQNLLQVMTKLFLFLTKLISNCLGSKLCFLTIIISNLFNQSRT